MNQQLFKPMSMNPIIDTDAYKVPHWAAIKPGLQHQYVYGECRSGSKYPEISYIGLQMVVQDHFLNPVTDDHILEAQEEAYMTFGTKNYFNVDGWRKVRDTGYLPMKIMSAPEGLRLPVSNVLFTAESTEDWFAPMLNGAFETMAMHFWYPTTVATRSMYIRERLKPLVEKSGSLELLPFLVNDFGARGTECWMSDYRGGVGHLVHFEGSDNMIASRAIGHYYGYKGRAKSVWATEHSCALSFGPGQGEYDYVNHQLDNCDPNLPCSIVIDTYDAFNHLKNVWGDPIIMAKIKARNAPTVGRPDSGEAKYSIERCLEINTSNYGFSINNKGYKVQNDLVRLLQGDGMNEDTIIDLYQDIVDNRWSTDNLLTGSGGGLLQADMTRDTQRIAIKPSFGIINNEEKNFQKTVATDTTKASKAGKLILHPTAPGGYQTFSSAKESPAMFASYNNLLKPLYENGNFYPIKFEKVLKNVGY